MDEEIDNLVKEYFDWFTERNPVAATAYGVHQYDHLLPDGSRDAILEDIDTVREFKKKFERIDPNKLSFAERIERDAMLHYLRIYLFHAEEYRQWESRPIGVDWIGMSILRLFTMDFAPLEERLVSITSRLQKAPQFLERYKSRITKPVKLWVKIQIESTKRFPPFLDKIHETAKGVLDEEKLEALEKAIQGVKDTLPEYEKWLEETLLPIAERECRMGEEMFKKLIELKNLGLSAEEVRSLGQEYLDKLKKQLEVLSDQIKPGASVEEVRELVRSNHPESLDLVMKEYRDSIRKAKDFIVEDKSFELPPGEDLKVMETPSYIRHVVPFAAYLTPGKFDDNMTGIYLVTPVDDKSELMKKHNYSGILTTTVHEGYPGHHLQLTMCNLNPSIVPSIVHSTETVEGWAHYTEDWMMERGFHDTLETRFVQTIDLIWRAVRIIVDVDLHSRRIDYDQAVDMLLKEVGIEKPSAVAEVKRYTANPGYQLCYLIGKHLITELREDVKRRMGDKYTDEFFHKTFLSAGSLPVLLIRQIFENKLQEMSV